MIRLFKKIKLWFWWKFIANYDEKIEYLKKEYYKKEKIFNELKTRLGL